MITPNKCPYLSPGQRPGLDEKFQSKKVPTLAKLEPRSIVRDTADTINIASAMDLGSSGTRLYKLILGRLAQEIKKRKKLQASSGRVGPRAASLTMNQGQCRMNLSMTILIDKILA